MRTLIDIPDGQIEQLARLSERRKTSRSAIIREAISYYLKQDEPDVMRRAFGLWKHLDIDSVEYQRKLREEW